jgi:hypothetical protein
MQHEINLPNLEKYCLDEYSLLRVQNILLGFINSIRLNRKYMKTIKDIFNSIFSVVQITRKRFNKLINMMKDEFHQSFGVVIPKLIHPQAELFGLDIGGILTEGIMQQIKMIWECERPSKVRFTPKKEQNNATQHTTISPANNNILRGKQLSF